MVPWPNKKIELYPTNTQIGSKTVECVRIRSAPKAPKLSVVTDDDLDDAFHSNGIPRPPPDCLAVAVHLPRIALLDVTLKTALALAKKGMQVFPCRPRQKEPAAHGCKDATSNAAIIQGWWRERPDANLAVPAAPPTSSRSTSTAWTPKPS